MLVGVISDIHSNWEALEAVVEDGLGRGVEEFWCLGDIVGYGADPEACTRWVMSNAQACVMGNHELALAEPGWLDWFNPVAREALEINRKMLSFKAQQWLAGLGEAVVMEGVRLVHGAPPESITTYLFELSHSTLVGLGQQFGPGVCFVGHTHVPALVRVEGGEVDELAPTGEHELEERAWWVVNPGSVGQPRDWDRRAAYALWDTQAKTVKFVRVEYDIEEAARKIIDRGLPAYNAHRLWI